MPEKAEGQALHVSSKHEEGVCGRDDNMSCFPQVSLRDQDFAIMHAGNHTYGHIGNARQGANRAHAVGPKFRQRLQQPAEIGGQVIRLMGALIRRGKHNDMPDVRGRIRTSQQPANDDVAQAVTHKMHTVGSRAPINPEIGLKLMTEFGDAAAITGITPVENLKPLPLKESGQRKYGDRRAPHPMDQDHDHRLTRKYCRRCGSLGLRRRLCGRSLRQSGRRNTTKYQKKQAYDHGRGVILYENENGLIFD